MMNAKLRKTLKGVVRQFFFTDLVDAEALLIAALTEAFRHAEYKEIDICIDNAEYDATRNLSIECTYDGMKCGINVSTKGVLDIGEIAEANKI